jgi:hypothetical protein
MAKVRHRTFEMYDFRAEAVAGLIPKSARLETTNLDPELWTFRTLDVALCENVISVQFEPAEYDEEAHECDLQADLINLADKLTNNSKVLMDFSGVESIGAKSIAAIEVLEGRLKHKGSRIVLCCLGPVAREAFFPPTARG